MSSAKDIVRKVFRLSGTAAVYASMCSAKLYACNINLDKKINSIKCYSLFANTLLFVIKLFKLLTSFYKLTFKIEIRVIALPIKCFPNRQSSCPNAKETLFSPTLI